KMEIFVGDQTGRVWGLNYRGEVLSQWPTTMGAATLRAPIIADIDGDGAQEGIAASTDGFGDAWHEDGAPRLAQIYVGGAVDGWPAVADIDGNGTVELIVATTLGRVYVFDRNTAWDPLKANWPMYQANARHTGFLSLDTDRDGDPDLTDCAPMNPAISHNA